MKNEIREKIAAATIGCCCAVDFDRVGSSLLKILCTDYPNKCAEILYEWDSRKMSCGGRMTENDDA